MRRNQIEVLYRLNGSPDYVLRSTDDLHKIHGIIFDRVPGFYELSDINRSLFKKFIVNFFNGFGLDSRITLYPLGINYVEHYDLLAKEELIDDCCIVVGGIFNKICSNGDRKLLHEWKDEDYSLMECWEDKKEYFLKFDYELHERREWLHVIKDDSWY